MALVSAFFDIFQRPTFEDLIFELMIFMVPFWAAVVVGILVGWAWRPKWVNTSTNFLDCTAKKGESHESVIAFTQFAASLPGLSSLKNHLPACIRGNYEAGLEKENVYLASVSSENFSSSKLECGISDIVNVDDLKHLHKLVENKDDGPSWIHMMDKSTNNMSYQAWRRDAETGPPQYRSRTVYEDATPEMLRDFFWDDEFRLKWDDMIVSAETLEECPTTGTTVVHWVRKFPFFCSDREYIIGRRIWDSGRSYYCVTKGVPRSSVPRRDKPRRVDLYYSSWCIRAAESKRDGRLTACEVLLFHHEDMGIPREIAKLGIRQGMWGAVRKIDPALRAYQKLRASKAQLSRSALMAQINTKADVDTEVEALDSTSISSEFDPPVSAGKTSGRSLTKILIVGGAIAFALSLDRGFLTKAVVFGVARRFGNAGKRLKFV